MVRSVDREGTMQKHGVKTLNRELLLLYWRVKPRVKKQEIKIKSGRLFGSDCPWHYYLLGL